MTPRESSIGALIGRAHLELEAPGATGGVPRIVPRARPEHPAQPIRLPDLTGEARDEIRARLKRCRITFLVDDSGSMYGAWGDPTGVRYAAALSVLGPMQRGGGGRAAVLHWGTEAPDELALAPVDVRRGRRLLRKALTVPPTLGGNDLPKALRAALVLTGAPDEDEQPLTVVLTDGIESVTPAMHAAVAAHPPGSVHMLLVDRSGGCSEEMERDWRTVAFGSFTRLRTFDTAAMAHQIGEALADALGLQMPGA